MFMLNNGTGYVLKPPYLINPPDDSVTPPAKILHIEVCYNIASSSIYFYGQLT